MGWCTGVTARLPLPPSTPNMLPSSEHDEARLSDGVGVLSPSSSSSSSGDSLSVRSSVEAQGARRPRRRLLLPVDEAVLTVLTWLLRLGGWPVKLSPEKRKKNSSFHQVSIKKTLKSLFMSLLFSPL